ncbi:hypothetical protein JQS43_10070 [Natronosporangium hydrolyticum]|uniref:Condensation domain-containing protein n=1 Tax=Natronosporangium hydrolyticum TaxID=2811111 RepID=A0A895YG93_9ACTN|nr:condensation domain-containing protein [Natronosporangium hydrolyticum]QSB16581.1 hypothetical protein JQS43_10070 [Natronosporangium hydrolyticum]
MPGAPSASPRRLGGAERVLWELQRRVSGAGVWNEALAVYVVGGRLAIPALTEAFHRVVRRHPALRTRYLLQRGVPTAVAVPPADVTLDLPVRGPGHCVWADELGAAAGRPFDLAGELPVRAAVLRYRGVDTLLLVLHRLAGDAETAGLVYRELAACYQALSAGAPAAPLLDQPADPYLERPAGPAAVRYWQDRLAGVAPALGALAIGRGAPPDPTFAGSVFAQSLGPTVGQAVPALARRLAVTEEVVLLAGYIALLAHHGGGPDLVIETHLDRPAVTHAGYRTGTLPVPAPADLSGSFAGLATRVHRFLRDAAAHPVPHQLVLPHPGDAAGAPRFRYAYRYRRRSTYTRLGTLPARPMPVDTGHSWHDLVFDIGAEPARFLGWVRYRTEIFDPDDVRALVQRYETLLCRA